MNDYDKNLDKNKANFVPLTPITFLERTKDIYPNYESVIYKKRVFTWKQTYDRCVKFASALEKHGIKLGDTVAIMAPNIPELFEAHYSVPMTGAVLNAINTRLDSKTVGYILEHGDAKALIVDRQFHDVVKKAIEGLNKKILIIDSKISSTPSPVFPEQLIERLVSIPMTSSICFFTFSTSAAGKSILFNTGIISWLLSSAW